MGWASGIFLSRLARFAGPDILLDSVFLSALIAIFVLMSQITYVPCWRRRSLPDQDEAIHLAEAWTVGFAQREFCFVNVHMEAEFMAKRSIIRKGDPTSHGGIVLEGHPTATIEGISIAGFGHMTHCPKCDGTFPIAEGVHNHTIYGIPTAVEGMRTGCGAYLIATQHTNTIGGDPGQGHGLSPGGLSSLALSGPAFH